MRSQSLISCACAAVLSIIPSQLIVAQTGFTLHPSALPMDANGWSIISATTGTGSCGNSSSNYTGTCKIYVTSSGNDATCAAQLPGTAEGTGACTTVAKAITLLRAGKPDWIMLHRGETFAESGKNIYGNKLGQDATHPFVMTAYPQDPSSFDDRPIFDIIGTTTSTFLQQQSGSFQGAFISIRFTNSAWDPNSVNYWTSGLQGIGYVLKIFGNAVFMLVEDCEFSYGAVGMQLEPATTAVSGTIIVRRNVFYNPAAVATAFIQAVRYTDFTIEDNLFYRGWTDVGAAPVAVTINVASPAVITYPAGQDTPAEDGGLPALGFGNPPLVALTGTLPTGLTAATLNCGHSNQCYYLCNISGNTANLSRSAACTSLINTTANACNSGCFSQWSDRMANVFSHNIYLGLGWDDSAGAMATKGGMKFRENISAYASATGSQSRPGGQYYNNLYLKNPIQITGVGWPSDIGYNVMLQAIDQQRVVTDEPQAWGMDISNFQCNSPASGACTSDMLTNPPNTGSSGSRIHHNILAKSEGTGGNGLAIRLNTSGTLAVGSPFPNIKATTGITVDHNIICDWPVAADAHPAAAGEPYSDQGSGNTVDNTNLPDPTSSNAEATCASLGISAPKSVADYYASIGGAGTVDDFLDAAKNKWTKISWDSAYHAPAVNNYIRTSYGMANP